jgi:hypothetical protein
MDYLQLATTGGDSKLRGLEYGEFDQIAWVTMKPEGPRIANVILDGVLPVDLQLPESDEKGVPERRVATVPARGTVTLDGKPLANVVVTFTEQMPAGRRPATADAITAADGTFVLTTNSKFDGAPVGTFKVTLAPNNRRPGGLVIEENDLPKVPTAYRLATTTPLTAIIEKDRKNELNIELTSKD